MKKTTLIDGVVVEEITPDITGEEAEKALRTLAEELIFFAQSRNKGDKTALGGQEGGQAVNKEDIKLTLGLAVIYFGFFGWMFLDFFSKTGY